MALRNGLYVMVVAEGEAIDAYSKHLGTVYVGKIPQELRSLYLSSLLDWLHEKYCREQTSFYFAPYYHGILYDVDDFKEPTEVEMLRLLRKSKMMPHDQREMLNVAVAVAKDMRQIIVETGELTTQPSIEPKPAEKPKTTRRTKAERIKAVKATVREFWVRTINGEPVTRQDIEKKHNWNESILSKDDGQTFMEKIDRAVETAKQGGNLQDLDHKTRATLLRFVRDITE